MINIALAVAIGLIAIVAAIKANLNGNEQGKRETAIRSSVDKFLDYLDDTRDSRYSKRNRDRMTPQYAGFRHDWYAYEDTYAYNFSMD